MADPNHQEINKLRGLLARLANEIDYKNHLLMEKEGLSLEKFATMSSLIEEKDRLLCERSEVIGSWMAQNHRLQEAFTEEMRKSELVKQEMKNLRDELEVQQQKLNTTTKELEELRALNDIKTVTTYSTNANRSLQSSEIDLNVPVNETLDSSQKRDELQNSLKMLDHFRVENEKARPQPRTLNKELNNKGAALHQLEDLKKELNEKREALHQLEIVNQTLISNECSSTTELKAARMETIKFFQALDGNGGKFGIKKIGEIDPKPFRDICFKKFCGGSWEEKSNELYSLWQEFVNVSSWNPLKTGEMSESVDENDKKLVALREEWGEEAYKAVVKALVELKEYKLYSPSKSSIIPELWNFEEGRRAYTKEAIQYIIQHCEVLRNKDNEQSGAILELTAEKERLLGKLAGTKILMEEKDKLLKERYAAIGKLAKHDKEEDTLIGKNSATINTLKAEKHIILESCNAEKKEMQYAKEEIETLMTKLQSQEVVEKQTAKHNERKRHNCGTLSLKIKEDSTYCNLDCLTDQARPFAKKLDSKVHYFNERISSTSENGQGLNILETLKQPKAEPDDLGETLNGGLSQPILKAMGSSPLQYSMVIDKILQELGEDQE